MPRRSGAVKRRRGTFRRAVRTFSVLNAEPHRHAHQLGDIPGAELVHDASAMDFNRARTDAELPASLLVGCTGNDLIEHVTLARRERSEAVVRHRPYGGDRISSVQR